MAFAYEVMIPAYNAARTLGAAIASLQDQEQLPERVIVVDDGSADATADIARELGAVVVPSTHAGVAAARAIALESVVAPYCAYLDADDQWCSFASRALRNWCEVHPDAAAVSGRAVLFAEGADTAVLRARMDAVPLPVGWERLRPVSVKDLWWRNVMTNSATMFRTQPLQAVGIRTHLGACEDYDVFLRLAARGHPMYLGELPITLREWSAHSLSSATEANLRAEQAILAEFMDVAPTRKPTAVPFGVRVALLWVRAAIREYQYHGSLAGFPPPGSSTAGAAPAQLVAALVSQHRISEPVVAWWTRLRRRNVPEAPRSSVLGRERCDR